MKEIKAIIQPAASEKVIRALRSMKGLPGCTVSHVHGYQKSNGASAGSEPEHEERIKIEIVVKDSDAKKVIDAIAKNAREGGPGDGKIFVMECTEVVRISTGERGNAAL